MIVKLYLQTHKIIPLILFEFTLPRNFATLECIVPELATARDKIVIDFPSFLHATSLTYAKCAVLHAHVCSEGLSWTEWLIRMQFFKIFIMYLLLKYYTDARCA